MSRVYFIPALVVLLAWLSQSAGAVQLISGSCVTPMAAQSPLSSENVTNLVTIGSRVQSSLIPFPPIDVGSPNLSANATNRATFQASFWDQSTGFHDLSSSPLFQFAPSMVAEQAYQPQVFGIPAIEPVFPPLFM